MVQSLSVRSLPELEAFLRLRLAQPLPGADAQWKFAPSPARKGWRPDDTPATARRAAALILLYPGEHGPSFPLTVRHDDLPHHPGQISLPGGALDPGEDAGAGALREAHEEIGIHTRDVRLIGPMSSLWVIVSNFLVQPFIGVTDARPEFRAHPGEVSELIEAPVSAFLNATSIGLEDRIRDGMRVRYPYFNVEGHHVWGATGMMLSEFSELLTSNA